MARYYRDTNREVEILRCTNCGDLTNLLRICCVCGQRFCKCCGAGRSKCPRCGEWDNYILDEDLGDPRGPNRKSYTPSVANRKAVSLPQETWVVCGTCEGYRLGRITDYNKAGSPDELQPFGTCGHRNGQYYQQRISVATPAPRCWDYSPYLLNSDEGNTPKDPGLVERISRLAKAGNAQNVVAPMPRRTENAEGRENNAAGCLLFGLFGGKNEPPLAKEQKELQTKLKALERAAAFRAEPSFQATQEQAILNILGPLVEQARRLQDEQAIEDALMCLRKYQPELAARIDHASRQV